MQGGLETNISVNEILVDNTLNYVDQGYID